MVERYWRKIENVENDIENAMQISSILLKLEEYDNDLGKIDTNENNISSNSGLISANTSSISSNLGKITNIENDLVDFTTHYSIENIYTYNITLIKEFVLNNINQEHHVFTYNIKDDFKIDSYLEVITNILYDYKSYSAIGRLSQIFRFYDEKNILLDEVKFAKSNAGDSLYENLTEKNTFYIKLNHNCSSIDIKVFIGFLHKTSSDITVKIIDPLKSNYLWIKYYKKIKKLSIESNNDFESDILSNTSLINTNTSDISSNLGKIGTNTTSISSNKSLISTNTSSISSNKSKTGTNTTSISSNKDLINTNTSTISDIENGVELFIEPYNETFIFSNRTITTNRQVLFEKIINFDFSGLGVFNILTTCNYDKYNFTHEYHFFKNDELIFKKILPYHQLLLKMNSNLKVLIHHH